MRTLIGFILAVGVVMTLPAAADAQGAKFSLKEKLQEKVICDSTCAEVATGSFLSKLQTLVGTNNVVNFDSSTTFSVYLGNFSIAHVLSDDPDYQTGDTSAHFIDDMTVAGGDTAVLDIKLSWKSGKLKMTMKGDTRAFTSPVASSFVGSAPGAINTTAPMQFTLVGANGLNLNVSLTPALVSGKLKRITKNVDGTDYDLDTITMTAGTN